MATTKPPRLRTCPKRRGGCGRKNHPDTFCSAPYCQNFEVLCLTCDCGSKYNNHNHAVNEIAARAAWEAARKEGNT